MSVSTVPTLKANLKAALDGLAADNTNALFQVRVSYGAAIHGNAREWVWLGDVRGHSHFAAIGHQRREEEYGLTAIFFTVIEGDNQQAATERAYQMAEAVATYLRANPTVGGAVRVCGFAGDFDLEERASDDGRRRGALLTTTLTCAQRI